MKTERKRNILTALGIFIFISACVACVDISSSISAAGGTGGVNPGEIIYSDNFMVNVLPLEINKVSGEDYASIPNNGETERVYRIKNTSNTSSCDVVMILSYNDGYNPIPGSGYGYSCTITGPATEEQYYMPGSILTVNPGEELFLTISMSSFYPAQIFPLTIEFQHPYTPRG